MEFGLIRSKSGLRIYGAGITSFFGEPIHCLDPKESIPIRLNFCRAFKTQYRIDTIQTLYMVIESFQQLFDAIKSLDWDTTRDFLVSFLDVVGGISIHPQEIIHTKRGDHARYLFPS